MKCVLEYRIKWIRQNLLLFLLLSTSVIIAQNKEQHIIEISSVYKDQLIGNYFETYEDDTNELTIDNIENVSFKLCDVLNNRYKD